jgi:hypothetical protein
LTDQPEAYNLPAQPVLPSTRQPAAYASGALAVLALVAIGLRIFRKNA